MNIRNEAIEKMKSLGVESSTASLLFDKGLIDERTAKKFLVREAYHDAAPEKGRKCEIREQIADKYCVSFETVGLYLKL